MCNKTMDLFIKYTKEYINSQNEEKFKENIFPLLTILKNEEQIKEVFLRYINNLEDYFKPKSISEQVNEFFEDYKEVSYMHSWIYRYAMRVPSCIYYFKLDCFELYLRKNKIIMLCNDIILCYMIYKYCKPNLKRYPRIKKIFVKASLYICSVILKREKIIK